jgi:hypothetical protein
MCGPSAAFFLASKLVDMLLAGRGVPTATPGRSAGNYPFSVAQFKTVRYPSEFPNPFGGAQDARISVRGCSQEQGRVAALTAPISTDTALHGQPKCSSNTGQPETRALRLSALASPRLATGLYGEQGCAGYSGVAGTWIGTSIASRT